MVRSQTAVRLNIHLPREDHTRLRIWCMERGKTLQEGVVTIISQTMGGAVGGAEQLSGVGSGSSGPLPPPALSTPVASGGVLPPPAEPVVQGERWHAEGDYDPETDFDTRCSRCDKPMWFDDERRIGAGSFCEPCWPGAEEYVVAQAAKHEAKRVAEGKPEWSVQWAAMEAKAAADRVELEAAMAAARPNGRAGSA